MDNRSPAPSIGWLVVAALNLLNGLGAAVWAWMLVSSPPDSTYGTSVNTLGIVQAISAVGMIGVGLCLIVRRKSALACAAITVVLLLIGAGIGVPWAASKSSNPAGLEGAMVALVGLIGTAIVAVIPAVTLIALLVAGRKPRP